MISKATESCNTSGTQKEEKVDEDGGHCSAEEEDDPDDIPEGFHLQEEVHTA